MRRSSTRADFRFDGINGSSAIHSSSVRSNRMITSEEVESRFSASDQEIIWVQTLA
jgi:hypothetical protein